EAALLVMEFRQTHDYLIELAIGDIQPALISKIDEQALADHFVENLPAQSAFLLGWHLSRTDSALHLLFQLLAGDGLTIDFSDLVTPPAEQSYQGLDTE